MVKKSILIAIAALVCAAALTLFVHGQRAVLGEPAPLPVFDAAAWSRLNARDSGDERLQMAKALLKSNALFGKSRAEVLGLLGQDCYRDPSGSLTYELRKTHGHNDQNVTGTDDLLVLFGPDGRVREARHVEWRAGN